MYYRFLKYIKENHLFSVEDSILLAVSGGKDSMFMLDIFMKSGIRFGVAHFNHVTRNGESDRDEDFVKLFCEINAIPFYSTSVSIYDLIKRGEGKNFQDVARKQRYKWLEDIRKNNNYDFIATAHNLDDNIETFLMKIVSGSGLLGLRGISSKINKIVRPILGISRKEIDDYIIKNKIAFVEDSSNSTDKYSRNFLRHNVIPQLRKMNDSLDTTMLVTMRNLKSAANAIDFFVDNYFERHINRIGDKIIIPKKYLSQISDKKDVIYLLLSRYDFNYSQIEDVIKSLNRTGPLFESISHQLLLDRENIVIRHKKNKENKVFYINEGENELNDIGILKIEILKNDGRIQFDNQKKYIDADKLVFPLKLRNWLPGDRFKPFGLKGRTKKMKKYLIDKKVNKFDKEKTFVLLNNDDICLVLGHDISFDFRIAEKTQNIAQIDFKKNMEG